MVRLYVLPLVTINGTRYPRYIAAPEPPDFPLNTAFSLIDYGIEPVCLLCAPEIDQTQHDLLVAQSDVWSPPETLDDLIPNAPEIRAALEPFGIPLQWITNGMTYRRVVRFISVLFFIGQGLNGRGAGSIFPTGATFNTLWEELPAAYQAALTAVFQRWYLPLGVLQDGTPLRDILEVFRDEERPFELAGYSF